MGCCDENQLLPVADALTRMQAAVQAITTAETLPLSQLLDRISAAPVYAGIDVPGHDNSAMDGYALCSLDTEQTIVGESLAGHPFGGQLRAGECVRITTGATLPKGAQAVVMQEDTHLCGDHLHLARPAKAGDHIRRAGEDIQQGQIIFEAGHRFGPVDVALLASLGVAELSVLRRLKVAVLSTGDELTAPGQPLPPGNIYDSNRYGIIAMLTRLNAEVIDLGLVADDRSSISAAFTKAAQQADVVISSGGVSVGQADYVKDILSELGQINFWKVAIKPGKPFAFGRLGRAVFFGLPGNPVSALVTLHQLALPVMQTMQGAHPEPALTITCNAGEDFSKRPGRSDFQRATLATDGHTNSLRTSAAQGSGVLTSFLGANAYAALEAERGRVTTGERVTAIVFDRFLR